MFLERESSLKGSVWRWGGGSPDLGVFVQMCVCLCVQMHRYVCHLSRCTFCPQLALSPWAASVLYHRHPY